MSKFNSDVQLLISCIVNFFSFLENSDDSIIDPDAAVQQMEDIVFRLNQLTEEGRVLLLNGLKSQLLMADKITSKSIENMVSMFEEG